MNKLRIFFGPRSVPAVEFFKYKEGKLSIITKDDDFFVASFFFFLIAFLAAFLLALALYPLNKLVIGSLVEASDKAAKLYSERALAVELLSIAYLVFVSIFRAPFPRISYRSPFLKALCQNNLKDLIALVGNRDVNSIKVHGSSLLAAALKYGSTSAVRYLLEKGARLSKTADDLLALKAAWLVRLHREKRLDLYLEDFLEMLSILEDSPEEYASFLADIEQEGVSIERFLHELKKTRSSEALENHLKRLRIEKALEKGHLERARRLGFEG